jgi:hypothetical protein
MKNLRRKLTKNKSKERVSNKGYMPRRDSKLYAEKENKQFSKIYDKKKLMRKMPTYLQKQFSEAQETNNDMKNRERKIWDEKMLNEDMPPRYLLVDNPNAPKVIANHDRAQKKLVINELVDQLVVHFQYDGHTILKESEEHKEQEEILEKRRAKIQEVAKKNDLYKENPRTGNLEIREKEARNIIRNKFNYSQRQTQTSSLILRHRGVSTAKPHLLNFSGEVNQSIIFDAYVNDVQKAKRVLSRSETENFSKNKRKGQKELFEDRTQEPTMDKKNEGSIYGKSFQRCLKITERMIVQNAEAEKYHDFKYMFCGEKEDVAIGNDTLIYPLWRFTYAPNKKNHVTCIAWNPKYR